MRVGREANRAEQVEDETLDTIKNNNEIRDAVAAVTEKTVGSDGWFRAVAAAHMANGDHMAEEEREELTEFRRLAPLALRHDLAGSFISFEAANIDGVVPIDKDPRNWVETDET